MKQKVLLGMSGGVDSSVAAKLLLDQGYEVTGMTLQLLEKETPGVMEDARAVADYLGIPWVKRDESRRFQDEVIDFFMDSYLRGETPNPCIRCNERIKFSILHKLIETEGYDYIATGHYAKILDVDGEWGLYKGKDEKKDQSYFLYPIHREWMPKILMPLGDYTKDEIRDLAKKWSLPVHNKPDSEDICFVPDGDYAKFIKERLDREVPKGDFVLKNGEVLGEHKGIIHYTVGQRRGLGLSLGQRAFVTEIDPDENKVVVGLHEDLFHHKVRIRNVNFLMDERRGEWTAEGRGRYAGKNKPLTVNYDGGDTIDVIFEEPLRAATKGQSVVIYENDRVLCGGIIDEILDK